MYWRETRLSSLWSLLLLVLFLVLLGQPLAKASNTSPEQSLVPTYLGPHQRRDATAYWSKVKSHLRNNKDIPQPGPDTFRVATYNIHYYRDIKDGYDNMKAMLRDIEAVDPAVVVFQEVPRDDPEQLKRALRKMGYGDMRLDINKNGGKLVFCGNLVAAKPGLRLEHIETLYLDEKRNAIAVSVHWKGYDIALIGTHLHEHYQEGHVRQQEAMTIMDWVERKVRPNYHYYLVLGDMNEGWNGAGVQTFAKEGMVEVFRGLDRAHPQMTCWAGIEIDFILSSPRLMQRCTGAFLWHSVQSDHMPVLADFDIPQRSDGANRRLVAKLQTETSHSRRVKVEDDGSENEDEEDSESEKSESEKSEGEKSESEKSESEKSANEKSESEKSASEETKRHKSKKEKKGRKYQIPKKEAKVAKKVGPRLSSKHRVVLKKQKVESDTWDTVTLPSKLKEKKKVALSSKPKGKKNVVLSSRKASKKDQSRKYSK